jgi:hypothetical protein
VCQARQCNIEQFLKVVVVFSLNVGEYSSSIHYYNTVKVAINMLCAAQCGSPFCRSADLALIMLMLHTYICTSWCTKSCLLVHDQIIWVLICEASVLVHNQIVEFRLLGECAALAI